MKITESDRLYNIATKTTKSFAKSMMDKSMNYDYIPRFSYSDYEQEGWVVLLKYDYDTTYADRQIIDHMWGKLLGHFNRLHVVSNRWIVDKQNPQSEPNFLYVPTRTTESSSFSVDRDDDTDKFLLVEDKRKKEPTPRTKIAEWVVKSCLPLDEEKRKKLVEQIASIELHSCDSKRFVFKADGYKKEDLVDLISKIKNFIRICGGYDNLFGDKKTSHEDLELLYEELSKYNICRGRRYGKTGFVDRLPRTFVGLDPNAIVSPPPKPYVRGKVERRMIDASLYMRNPNGKLKCKNVNGIRYRIFLDGTLEDSRIKYKKVDDHYYVTLPTGETIPEEEYHQLRKQWEQPKPREKPCKRASKPPKPVRPRLTCGVDPSLYMRQPCGVIKLKFINGVRYRVLLDGTFEDSRIKYKKIKGKYYVTLPDGKQLTEGKYNQWRKKWKPPRPRRRTPKPYEYKTKLKKGIDPSLYMRHPCGAIKHKLVNGVDYRVFLDESLEDARIKYKRIDGNYYVTLLSGEIIPEEEYHQRRKQCLLTIQDGNDQTTSLDKKDADYLK